MEKLSFKLDIFEGPLDLMLSLISKHKLNIYDIEIAKLLEQYLAYIEQMKMLDLEVASEFLEMAARLVHIKTVMLLPKYDDEAEDLKRELTGQLLEYQLCKEIAAIMSSSFIGFDIFVKPPEPLEIDRTYKYRHPKEDMLTAYLNVLGKGQRKLPPPASSFTDIVQKRVVSVQSKIITVLRRLYSKTAVGFRTLFDGAEDRSEIVATFLAVLELLKSKRIMIDNDTNNVQMITREEAKK